MLGKSLRNYPYFLPNLLSRVLRDLMAVPPKIKIPEDPEVTVTFVYPTKGKISAKPETAFRLRYLRIPA